MSGAVGTTDSTRVCRADWSLDDDREALRATAAMSPIVADGLPRIDFPTALNLSMIFGTSALWHRYKTKVPLLMCLAFVSLYQLTISL